MPRQLKIPLHSARHSLNTSCIESAAIVNRRCELLKLVENREPYQVPLDFENSKYLYCLLNEVVVVDDVSVADDVVDVRVVVFVVDTVVSVVDVCNWRAKLELAS